MRFDLPEAAAVRIEVFDVLGRRVLSPQQFTAEPAMRTMAGSGRMVVAK